MIMKLILRFPVSLIYRVLLMRFHESTDLVIDFLPEAKRCLVRVHLLVTMTGRDHDCMRTRESGVSAEGSMPALLADESEDAERYER